MKKGRLTTLKLKKISQILASKNSVDPYITAPIHEANGQGFPTAKLVNSIWEEKNKPNLEGNNIYSLKSLFQESPRQENPLKRKPQKGLKKEVIKQALSSEVTEKASDTWVRNKVHPHHYSNILGYRKKNVVVNPNVTLQGIRRVLHYLKTIIQVTSSKVNAFKETPAELIILVESSVRTDAVKENTQASSAALIAYSLLRLQDFNKLKITTKTAKETISYLASASSKSTIKKNICGILILNPAKSILGNLADTLFNQTNKKDKKISAGNAIGALCAKKGIPLISLCDIASPINLYTYPIVCDTRDVKSIYLVLDLLTYGLNRLKA